MAWFSKKSKDETAEPNDGSGPGGSIVTAPDDDGLVAEGHTGRPVSRALNAAERERVAATLAQLTERGVDVDDLDSIGLAYDTAFSVWASDPEAQDSGQVIELVGTAIGEHLARHSAREWAVVTDVFGTDLGLVAASAETVIVPHNIVSARWMRRDRGWVPAVVRHLVLIRPRPEAAGG